jgi:hypothetical protein
MLNHEEKIKLAQKKKKILLAVVLIIVGVFLLLGVTLLILSGVRQFVWEKRVQEHVNPMERRYIHPDPDWDKNIFEDSQYMSLDRSVRHNSEGTVITAMTDENKELYSVPAQFMYDVVQIIINGDYEAYNALFADEYWEDGGEDFMFPMQALYKIEIQIIDMTETTADVKLSYTIYKNDGMFRPDLPPNIRTDEEAVRPIVYTLAENARGELQILKTSVYSFIATENFD